METPQNLNVKDDRKVGQSAASVASPVANTLQLDDVKLDPSVADRRAELLGEFIDLKHQLGQIRAERDRLVVENRDLSMKLAVVEADYASLFSYVEASGLAEK